MGDQKRVGKCGSDEKLFIYLYGTDVEVYPWVDWTWNVSMLRIHAIRSEAVGHIQNFKQA